jgi:GTP-binding protein
MAALIVSSHKPCILVVNKWDLAKGHATSEDYGDYLAKTMPNIAFAPVAFTSAISGRNIWSTLDLATELFKQANHRIGTGQLNQALNQAMEGHPPASKRGRKPMKFYYATQVAVNPPTIVVFVNAPQHVTGPFERFLLNRMRESLPINEIPIRLVFKARRESSRA